MEIYEGRNHAKFSNKEDMVTDYFSTTVKLPKAIIAAHHFVLMELVMPKRLDKDSATPDQRKFIKIMQGIFGQSPNNDDVRTFLSNPAIKLMYGLPARTIGIKQFKYSNGMVDFLGSISDIEYRNLSFLLSDKVQIMDLLPQRQ